MPCSTVMSGIRRAVARADDDVAQIEVVRRHIDRHQRFGPLPPVDRELPREEPEQQSPCAESSISTTRLNPYSLSGENATTSCFTGA